MFSSCTVANLTGAAKRGPGVARLPPYLRKLPVSQLGTSSYRNQVAYGMDVLKKCLRCKQMLPGSAFGTHVHRGETVLYSSCKTCRPKHNAMAVRYNKSDKGKASHKKAREKYKKSDKGKANNAKYMKSDKGKAVRANYLESAIGKAAKKRVLAVQRARCAKDPAYAMQRNITSLAARLLSGHQETSPKFVKRTGFRSESHFLKHMSKMAKKIGMSLKDHGKVLDCEHKIPIQAYDFRDPEDVKRCWSESNVRMMLSKENKEKSIKIIDELVLEVDPSCWPKSWNGKIPTDDEKEAFYAKCQSAWEPFTSKKTADVDTDSNDVDMSNPNPQAQAASSSRAGPSAPHFSTDTDEEEY